MWIRTLIVPLLFSILSQCSPVHEANLITRQTQSSTPLPPSQDPWYTAPTGWESTTPGTILRSRPAPGNATAIVGNCSAVYNLLYRSTNSQYQPSWGVTTLLIPSDIQNTSLLYRLLSYHIPYDSCNIDQTPSYLLYSQPPSDISRALGEGFLVNVPDYEGPTASFTAGVNSGHSTLDSIRAALNHINTTTSSILNKYHMTNLSATRTVMWGYSGGAIATEFALELQPQYAPDLSSTLTAAALGGLTPNLTRVFEQVSSSGYAELIVNSLIGLSTQWPSLATYLSSHLLSSGQYNATTFLSARNRSVAETIGIFLNQNILMDYLNVSLEEFVNVPAIKRILARDTVMGYHGTPNVPLFVYKAIQDELAPIGDTDDLVARWCGVDVGVEYQRNTVGNHLDEYYNGDERAFQWVKGVLNGGGGGGGGGGGNDNIVDGCVVKNVTSGNVVTAPFLGNGTGGIP